MFIVQLRVVARIYAKSSRGYKNIQSAVCATPFIFNCWSCLSSVVDYNDAEYGDQTMMYAKLVLLLLLSLAGLPSLAGMYTTALVLVFEVHVYA